MLIGESLVVDIDLARIAHRFGGAYDFFEVSEILHIHLVEPHQLIVVEGTIFKAIAHHTLHVGFLQLLQHAVHIQRFHLRARNGYYRAEIEKFAHFATLPIGGLTCLSRHSWHGSEHLQGAVGGKVEHVGLLFHAAVDGGGCLHTEYGLHIARCGCVERATEHQHAGPLLHAHPCGEASARESDGACLVGVSADSIPHGFERIVALLIAIASHIHHREMLKHCVLSHQFFHGLCRFHARKHPQRVAEYVAIILVGKRIATISVFFGEQIEEGAHIVGVDECAILFHTEKLTEIESHILVDKVVEQSPKVVGEDVHRGQSGVGVGVAWVCLIPCCLGALLHHIVPCVDVVFLVVVEQVEWCATEAEHLGGGLNELGHNILAQFGLGAFVGFVDDDKIPRRGKHLVVFVKLATHRLRPTQVLHRGEVDVASSPICMPFER